MADSWLPQGFVDADGKPRNQPGKSKRRGKKGGTKIAVEVPAAPACIAPANFERLSDCCSWCGNDPSGAPFKRCAACGITAYCSAECQRDAWKRAGGSHKASCGSALPTPASLAGAAPTILVSVLAEFGRADAALAELCLGRLAEPSMIAGTRSACGGAGRALDGLVASLRAHSGVAAVQAYGCRALRSVALGASAIQQAAVAAGGAEVVAAALRAHAGCAEVQLEGCACLGNLAGADATCQVPQLSAWHPSRVPQCTATL